MVWDRDRAHTKVRVIALTKRTRRKFLESQRLVPGLETRERSLPQCTCTAVTALGTQSHWYVGPTKEPLEVLWILDLDTLFHQA
jgi:hypothetical protein